MANKPAGLFASQSPVPIGLETAFYHPLVEESTKALMVYLVNGGAGGTASNFGDPFPGAGTAAGAEDPGGDMAPLLVDGSGNLKVSGSLTVTPISSTTATTPAQETVDTTAETLLAANPLRKRMIFQNNGTTRIKLGLGGTPTQSNYHVCLPAGGSANDGSSDPYIDDMWKGAVEGISSGAGGLVNVTELT